MRSRGPVVCALFLAAVATAYPQSGRRTRLIIVSGLGGEPSYRDQFYQWAISMRDAAKNRFGLDDDSIWYYAEKPDRDPEKIRGKSDNETLTLAF